MKLIKLFLEKCVCVCFFVSKFVIALQSTLQILHVFSTGIRFALMMQVFVCVFTLLSLTNHDGWSYNTIKILYFFGDFSCIFIYTANTLAHSTPFFYKISTVIIFLSCN